MSSYVIGSLIGGGFVLLGSLLATIRESKARHAERRAAAQAELKAAMREFLAALDAIAVELSDLPGVPPRSGLDAWLDRAAERTGLHVWIHIALRLLRRAAYGRRHDELSDRLVAASAQLRLIAPPAILQVLKEIQEMSDRHPATSGRWTKEWKVARERVSTTFRQALQDPTHGLKDTHSLIRRVRQSGTDIERVASA